MDQLGNRLDVSFAARDAGRRVPGRSRLTANIPAEIWALAHRRSDARAAGDWATADALRAEIEAAGWRVVDAGTDFRLEPAPADVDVGGEIRYGRSDTVPSRLDEPPTGLASVVLVASADPIETQHALDALVRFAPDGTDLVLVADGLPDRALEGLRGDALTARAGKVPSELVRTSAVLGHAAAINAGIRRARAGVVIVMDPSIIATGDLVAPLVGTLDDPTVAIAGPFGLTSGDLRTFDEAVATRDAARDVAAVQGYLMAFRRADAQARGPLDEAFRYYRNLDIWWSLMLRDEGEDATPRRAVAVPDVPVERGEPRAWATTPAAERDRLSKRNFYRVLDRFRTRTDLAVG